MPNMNVEYVILLGMVEGAHEGASLTLVSLMTTAKNERFHSGAST